MSNNTPSPVHDNWFEDQKRKVIGAGKDILEDVAGIKIGEREVGQKALEKTVRAAEIITTPYREKVAPNLTAALLWANPNYREQNAGLNDSDLFQKAKEDSKRSAAEFYQEDPETSWRRSISPGRALVSLVGAYVPGEQKTDKINWSDVNDIERAFDSGSAQFWSGFADAGFSVFTDPLFLASKGAKAVKVATLTRPVGKNAKGIGRILPVKTLEKLTKDVDDAVAGKQNGFRPYLDALKDAQDIQPLLRYSFIANSANPELAATAVLSAYKYGGDEAVGEVTKVMLGDINAFNRIAARDNELTVIANEISGRVDAVEESIRKIGTNIQDTSRLNLSAKKIQQIEQQNKKLLEQQEILRKQKEEISKPLKEINKERKNLEVRIGVAERDPEKALTTTGTDTLFGAANTTWSKFNKVERIRAVAAQVDADGYWGQVDPLTDSQLANKVADKLKISKPLVRMSYWLSPNAQIGEVPAGVAILDGIPSQFAYREVNSRLRQAVKLGDFSPKWARAKAEKWSRLVTAGERFKFLDNLEQEVQLGIIKKQFPKLYDRLDESQREALRTFVTSMHRKAQEQRTALMRDVLDKNYTQIDIKAGSVMAAKQIEDLVNTLALSRAHARGSNVASKADVEAVKNMLRENPTFITQQPNIHFTTNMIDISNVVKENKLAFQGFLEEIISEGLDAQDVARKISQNEKFKMATQGSAATAYDVVTSRAKKSVDRLTDILDVYQTFIWKPATLLSAKYTTRNVFEGYLRVITSAVEMNASYGYGWTDMVRGFGKESFGAPVRAGQNVGIRIGARRSAKEVNRINRDLAIVEKEIAIQVGKLPTRVKNTADKIIENRIKELPEELFKANDTVTLPLSVINGKVDRIVTHIGTVKDRDAARIVRNNFKKVYNTKGLDAREQKMLKALLDEDYDTSYKVSVGLDAAQVSRVFDTINDNMQAMAAQLNKLKLDDLSPAFAKEIQSILFFTERLALHTDAAKIIFVSKDKITGKFVAAQAKASAKPKLKGKYEGKVEIAKGVYIGAGFAGDADEMLRVATSARSSNIRMLNQNNRVTGAHILHDGYEVKTFRVDDPMWVPAHAEYVNNVLMKDPLANRMIKQLASGKTGEEVAKDAISWLRSGDAAARRYMREEKFVYKEYSENAANVSDLVKEKLVQIEAFYLPDVDEFGNPIRVNVGKQAKSLVEIAAEGKMSPEISAYIPMDVRNPVSGTLERISPDAKIFRNVVNSIFHFIATLPEDHLIRHPFYSMVHDSEARRLATVVRTQALKQGKNADEANAMVRQYADKIKRTASTRAYKELMQRMYSVERYTDFGSLMRFVTPFYMAHQNSSRYWLGTSLRNPEIAITLAKAYNAPYRAGLVQDEEGNTVGYGSPWSTSRDQLIIGYGEKGIGKKLREFTGQTEFRGQPTAIDVITQGQLPVLPTAGGPVGQTVVTLALSRLSPDSITQKYLGVPAEDIVNKYILPYYEKTQGKGVIGTVLTNINPMNSWMLSAMAALTKGDPTFATDEANIRFNARYFAAYDMLTADALLNGQALNNDELRAQAAKLATNSLWVEALSSFLGPVVAFKVGDEQMRELDAELNRLRKANGGDADAAALQLTQQLAAKYDSPYVPAVSRLLTTRSTNNRLGLLSTQQTYDNLKANKALVEQIDLLFPDRKILGELLSSGDPNTDYSPFVEDKMFATDINGKPLREKLDDPKEREKRQQYSMAWEIYFSNIEYIEAHAAARNISRHSKYYQENYTPWKKRVEAEIGTQFPLWATRDKSIDLNKTDVNLAIVNRLLEDKKFMDTVGKDSDAMAGIELYMGAREILVARLEAEAKRTGIKGADTDQNRWILEWKERVVDEIEKQHPGFGRVYTRYLSDDMLTPIPSFAELDEGK